MIISTFPKELTFFMRPDGEAAAAARSDSDNGITVSLKFCKQQAPYPIDVRRGLITTHNDQLGWIRGKIKEAMCALSGECLKFGSQVSPGVLSRLSNAEKECYSRRLPGDNNDCKALVQGGRVEVSGPDFDVAAICEWQSQVSVTTCSETVTSQVSVNRSCHFMDKKINIWVPEPDIEASTSERSLGSFVECVMPDYA